MTSTATRIIHRRNNRLPSENRCIRDPFDERRHVDGRWGRFLQFGGDINLVDSTVRDRTAQVLLRLTRASFVVASEAWDEHVVYEVMNRLAGRHIPGKHRAVDEVAGQHVPEILGDGRRLDL